MHKPSFFTKLKAKTNLAWAITLLTFFAIVIAGGAILIASYELLSTAKVKDLRAITFLEMEKRGREVNAEIDRYDFKKPLAIIEYKGKMGWQIYDPKKKTNNRNTRNQEEGASDKNPLPFELKELAPPYNPSKSPNQVKKIAGKIYLLKYQSSLLTQNQDALVEKQPSQKADKKKKAKIKQIYAIYPFELQNFFKKQLAHGAPTMYIYLANRAGQLLYRNTSLLTEKGYISRPLVQQFILEPFSSSMSEFIDPLSEALYLSFYLTIPKTNMVFYNEVEKSFIFAEVTWFLVKMLVGFAGIMLVVLIILQFPLMKISKSIRMLAAQAMEIEKGNLSVQFAAQGFGEILFLGNTFASMGRSLKEKDEKITAYIEEQKEKVRLAGELELAKQVQENLLIVPEKSKMPIDVFAHYYPAEEVAGDWYGYFHFPEKKEAIIAIADVSGHGAGACIFTAVVASCFTNFMEEYSKDQDLTALAKTMNHSILTLGKGAWHATAQFIRLNLETKEALIVNCGHVGALLLKEEKDKKMYSGKYITPPSTPLGMEEDPIIKEKTVQLKTGDYIVMYSDGIIETYSPEGQMYGKKKFRSIGKEGIFKNSKALSGAIEKSWRTHANGRKADDDFCVVVVRV